MMNLSLSFSLFCFLCGVLIFRSLRVFALSLHIVDNPDGVLKRQQAPVAYLGGLGLMGTVWTSLMVWDVFLPYDLFVTLFCVTMLGLFGLVDDLRPMTPLHKFLGQVGVVALWWMLMPPLFSLWIGVCLSLWFLIVINAFNLVDVMDGLTATLAGVGIAGFITIAFVAGQYGVFLFGVALIAALCAFLTLNLPPARMYLGDSGSLFLGGVCAFLPLHLWWNNIFPFAWILVPFYVAIPLAELFFLILLRTLKKIPFYKGSRDHFSHYLARKGWSVRNILILSFGVAFLSASVACVLPFSGISICYWYCFFGGGGIIWSWIIMGKTV